MTKATHKKTVIDVLKNQKRLQKKTYGLGRQNLAGYSSVSGGLAVFHQASSADSGGGNVTSLIKAAGDTMVGPMAYFLAQEDIVSGELDVSQDGGYSSRVVVGSQSGTTDDLVRISGSIHAGQILFLQGKSTDTITIKHYTDEGGTKGNIYIPSGNNYTLAAKEIVLLQWDTQNVNPTYSSNTAEVGQWTLVATSTGSGGGGSGANTSLSNLSSVAVNTTLDLNNQNIEDVNALKINSDGAGSADSFTMFGTTSAGAINLVDDNDYFAIQVDGDSKLRIYDDKIEIYEPLETTTASSPDIGSSSYPFGTVYAAGFNTLGTLSVGSTSLLIGNIQTNGPIKAYTDFIGVQCTDEVFTTGSQGTIQIPEIYNNSEPATSDLNGWFGNADGCIGIMRTSTQTRLYARSNAVWKYEILS